MIIQPKENIPEKNVKGVHKYNAEYFDLQEGFVKMYNDLGDLVILEKGEWLIKSWLTLE